ncbi:YraN family protein [Diaphorobacter sp. HDW4A]|uniref:YraN family protein n=1 Tax=Diaphorobacter sp. HDW4A TaxID=2714924 RepID=UPI001409B050|nr:YraN family protein [Diaphorobacter sp. HDW4A]QIL82022.1 YraN family protein [Diaphorobacter sp. HDW4A]
MSDQTTRVQGMFAEDQALAYLQKAGLKLVTRNYRTPGRGGGEIDLIMRDRDGTLVFVEVRSRGSAQFGGAGASIGQTKQRRIILAARHYLAALVAHPPCRFDVVLIEREPVWLKSAFDAGD